MAILNRVAELGGEGRVGDLEPYLTDYDPVLAERVAEILGQWTGEDREARPNPVVRTPVPSPEEVDALDETRVVLEMARGGEIEIQILGRNAPTHTARFVRLARAGELDGLTYHRVVTNFVLQGGSPGANEFHGDAAYARDELGMRSHWRGTVGTSTRGRDTADGQMFINLIDNLRLDHNYTIFGEVVRGMDTADLVAEGDVITHARVVGG
jgi:cyclophilin family peptidyl-prolyl cis-trans isomerase